MGLLYEDITYQIRGACFWVYKEFGGAFKEKIIDRALTKELIKRGLKVDDQKRINIFYQGEKVGIYVPDKIINDKVLLEIKAKPSLTENDGEQFWKYLKGSPYKLGILINFSPTRLEIKRIVYDQARNKRQERSASDPRNNIRV